jgi:Zn-dependent protease
MLGPISDTFNNLVRDPQMFVITALLLVVAITLHEFGHAIVAVTCGDPTPARDGRVTLNPLAHLDPMGTLGMFFFGFGWGKPVMVHPGNFRNGRWDDIKVSAAGPAMNLVQALIFGIALRGVLVTHLDPGGPLVEILWKGMMINVGLMAFNLIPIGPLDGAHILKGFLPLQAAYDFNKFNASWGMVVMFGLLYTGKLSLFIGPVTRGFQFLVLGPGYMN